MAEAADVFWTGLGTPTLGAVFGGPGPGRCAGDAVTLREGPADGALGGSRRAALTLVLADASSALRFKGTGAEGLLRFFVSTAMVVVGGFAAATGGTGREVEGVLTGEADGFLPSMDDIMLLRNYDKVSIWSFLNLSHYIHSCWKTCDARLLMAR